MVHSCVLNLEIFYEFSQSYESHYIITFIYFNSTEQQTSSPSISINPPLDLVSSASMKIEDSALPATTTEQQIENLLENNDTTNVINPEDKNNANKPANNVMKESTTEVIVMASLDTQTNMLKGMK